MKRAERMDISPATSTAAASTPAYSLPPTRFYNEDILFCVDIDVEALKEMKASGPKTPFNRIDAIKQAILLFVNAKLAVCPDHRFAFSVLARSFTWLQRDLTNGINDATGTVRRLGASNTSYGIPDLTSLFQTANQEAIKSRAQGRLFRVILIYCRSSSPPRHRWPVSEKLFTMDVMYLHDKPDPGNCPQEVYDSLADALDHVSLNDGYIFESGHGLLRVLCRQMCLLLCHPLQRCTQDNLDIPKSLVKRVSGAVAGMNGEESTTTKV